MSSQDKHDSVDAFLTLLSGCERRLYGYILSLVQNFHDADDIAQETRTRLWQQFETFEPDTNFEGWARTIAHYQVLTHREKQHRGRLQFQPELMETLADEYAAESEQFEARQAALLHCLETMNATLRRLTQLVYGQGLSIKEAALAMQRPVEGTYKALWRARRSLHDCIRRRLREGEA